MNTDVCGPYRGAPLRSVRCACSVFRRAGFLLSFFLESVFLSLLGGLLGCLLVLPLNNLQTGIGSFVTFSELTFGFRVSPQIMVSAWPLRC